MSMILRKTPTSRPKLGEVQLIMLCRIYLKYSICRKRPKPCFSNIIIPSNLSGKRILIQSSILTFYSRNYTVKHYYIHQRIIIERSLFTYLFIIDGGRISRTLIVSRTLSVLFEIIVQTLCPCHCLSPSHSLILSAFLQCTRQYLNIIISYCV